MQINKIHSNLNFGKNCKKCARPRCEICEILSKHPSRIFAGVSPSAKITHVNIDWDEFWGNLFAPQKEAARKFRIQNETIEAAEKHYVK